MQRLNKQLSAPQEVGRKWCLSHEGIRHSRERMPDEVGEEHNSGRTVPLICANIDLKQNISLGLSWFFFVLRFLCIYKEHT